MGVPAFFRWLSAKYPKIVAPVQEELPHEVDGETVPVDTTGPNPNGEEFDNLYLDFNGIVHPCSHPEDKPPPKNEEEMMLEIFKYTERVINMVRPRKLLMIAIDGVAPRAKMNQQRARRFRSVQEKKEKDDQKEEFRKLLLQSQQSTAGEIDSPEEEEETWDSNVITPGTPFMHTLSRSIQYWVAYKLNTDPLWEKLKVIISDAWVPGEGEHKIMEFIRSQRRSPEYDPNTHHVMYGLDADLIMLGIATHEPHFRILREDVFFQSAKPGTCRLCGQPGHLAAQCRGERKKKRGEFDEKDGPPPLKPFIWLKVNVLREYLAQELSVPHQGFKFDLERALDDWVFLCFFVGNDFLPHLPSLSIREEGIDALIASWRDNLPLMGGYVTKDGHVDLDRTQHILSGLAVQEDAIFKRRKQIDDKREAGAKRRKLQDQRSREQNPRNGGDDNNWGTPANQNRNRRGPQENHADVQLFAPGDAKTEVRKLTHEMMVNKKANFQASISNTNAANKSAAAVLKEQLLMKKRLDSQANMEDGNGDATPDSGASNENGIDTQPSPSTLGKRKASMMEEENGTPGRSTPVSVSMPQNDSDELPPDDVRLWEDGYADRYYEHKFKVDPKDIAFRREVARSYVEGVCWVLLYYMQGCPSWTWYYPYHYAPFAADFVDIGKLDITFQKGQPFKPFEQLMGVFPAASRHAIPETFHPLMLHEDSEIIDFYPEDFPLDLNGKKFKWQAVVLLPFIDEKRLLDAMNKRYPLLTPEEQARNETGKEMLLFSTKHPMYDELAMNWYSKKQGAPKMRLNPKKSEGLSGEVERNEDYIPQSSLIYPLSNGVMPDLDDDQSMSVIYEMPKSTHVHKSMLLRGVQLPAKELDHSDLNNTNRRANNSGRSYGGVPLHNDRNGGQGNNGGRFNYSNPFAAHLNPNFDPSVMQRAPPPPHVAAQMAAQGYVPPPPPGWGGPPPPMPNMTGYQGHQNQGGGQGSQGGQGYGRDQYQYQQQGYDGYSRGGQGRRDDRSHNYGGGRGGRGGRGGGGGGGGYGRY